MTKGDDVQAVKLLMGLKKAPTNTKKTIKDQQNANSAHDGSPDQKNKSIINFKNKLSQMTPKNKHSGKEKFKEPKVKMKHKIDLRNDFEIV